MTSLVGFVVVQMVSGFWVDTGAEKEATAHVVDRCRVDGCLVKAGRGRLERRVADQSTRLLSVLPWMRLEGHTHL